MGEHEKRKREREGREGKRRGKNPCNTRKPTNQHRNASTSSANDHMPRRRLSHWLSPATFPAMTILALLLSLFSTTHVFSLVQFPRQSEGAVLLTGASTGIGRSAAIALCARGFTVVAGVRNVTQFQSALLDLAARRGCPPARLHIVKLDVTDAQDRERALQTVLDLKLRFAALISNAGVSQDLPLELATEQGVREVMEVNFFAPMLLARRAIPHLKQHKGRLVTVGSLAGRLAAPGQAIYASSKHALEGMHDSVRRELLEFGVVGLPPPARPMAHRARFTRPPACRQSVSLIDAACVESAIFGKSIGDGDPGLLLRKEQYDMYERHSKRRNYLLQMCKKWAADPDASSSPDIVHAVTDEVRRRPSPGADPGSTRGRGTSPARTRCF
jgi:NAD(P)-dependent dehydrogenase (short-subunit alcohol dehydrogenase family)